MSMDPDHKLRLSTRIHGLALGLVVYLQYQSTLIVVDKLMGLLVYLYSAYSKVYCEWIKMIQVNLGSQTLTVPDLTPLGHK